MGILGIDPGTLKMGYGVISEGPNPHADDYGVIALPRKMHLEQRLYQLHTHILKLIAIFQPTAVAVEQPFVGKGERAFPGSALAIGQAPDIYPGRLPPLGNDDVGQAEGQVPVPAGLDGQPLVGVGCGH